MENILTDICVAHPARCNASGVLSMPSLASDVLEVSSRHADLLGVTGLATEGIGWVLSRLTIEMEAYPAVDQEYCVSTWVSQWNRHFSERCYRIFRPDGSTLGYARAVWMLINLTDHSGVGLEAFSFPEEMIGKYDCNIERQRRHRPLEGDVHEKPYVFEYSDIDFYRHVNTLRYIQIIINTLPLSVYDTFHLRRFEVAFMHEALFDQRVNIRSTGTDSLKEIHIAGENIDILRARLKLEPRQ